MKSTRTGLSLEIKPGESLRESELEEIIGLCSRAFQEPFTPYIQVFKNPIHILGRIGGEIITHALWITRWLQVKGSPIIKTAYVEAVATEEGHRRKGYASAVMTCLADQIQDHEIGGLSPAETTLYVNLGWEYWQGPLYARKGKRWLLVPDETFMIFRTLKTPPLDTRSPISIEWREGEIW
jgi:aminoglycoside 2'-N-acetyltransferase I